MDLPAKPEWIERQVGAKVNRHDVLVLRFPARSAIGNPLDSLPAADTPSVHRKPAASSKSLPGVRMVTETGYVRPPVSTRISMGSTAATKSLHRRRWPSVCLVTVTRVVLQRLLSSGSFTATMLRFSVIF